MWSILTVATICLLQTHRVLGQTFPMPELRPVLDILDEWPVIDVQIPHLPNIHQGSMARLDYQTQIKEAVLYREQGIPFVLINVPEATKLAQTWTDDYLSTLFGEAVINTHVSQTGQFLFEDKKRQKKKKSKKRRRRSRLGSHGLSYDDASHGRKQRRRPTRKILSVPNHLKNPVNVSSALTGQQKHDRMLLVQDDQGYQPMTFSEFQSISTRPHSPYDKHYYFVVALNKEQLAGQALEPWKQRLGEDIQMFQHGKKSFFLADEDANNGVNCRFGMPGIYSVAHFDFPRNAIALYKGQKRFILAPPQYCQNIYPRSRSIASARHSLVDWRDPDLEKFPLFSDLQVTQVVLKAGEVLILPSYWMHFIVTVGDEISGQCNGWSGATDIGAQVIRDCGFPRAGANTTRDYQDKH